MTETTSPAVLSAAPSEEVRRGFIALLLMATFGASMALIVPMAFSLALRVGQLAPGDEGVLGYLLGIASVFSLAFAPLSGTLSDRTRSRRGRRTPYTLGGGVLGTIALMVMAFAPNLIVLGAGWVLATLGWGTALGSLANTQADRIPAAQRGRVAGLAGFVTQLAPVLGVLLVGTVSGDHHLVFLIPAAVGLRC